MPPTALPAILCSPLVINSPLSSQAGNDGVHPDLSRLISDQTSASRGSIIERDFPRAPRGPVQGDAEGAGRRRRFKDPTFKFWGLFFVLKRLRTDLTLSTECEDVVSTRSIYYVEEKSTHASVLKDRNPIVYLNRRQPDSIAPHRFSWKMYARNNFSPVRTLSYLLQSQKTKTPQISSN